jgi:hypothetical protein
MAIHLVDESGHDFIYHCAVQEAAARLNIGYGAYVPQHCKMDVLPEGWTKFFRSKSGCRFMDFSRLLYRQKGIFFLESFNTFDLFALTLASLFFAGKQSRLWVLYRQIPKYRKIHLWFSKLLKWRWQSRFVLMTDSELIQGVVLPIPHTEIKGALPKNEKIICWWPGKPRAAKGWEVMRRIVPLADPALIEIICARASGLPVRLIDDVLTREEYTQWMLASDVILLPYDPKAYRSGTSGIFVEAIIAGKLPVVCDGGWPAYELKKFGLEELILDWTDPFPRILELLRCQPTLEKLANMREEYLIFHSLDTFVHKLREIYGKREMG